VAELGVLHYFYLNPVFAFLNSHAIFTAYFQNLRQYFIHAHSFQSPVLALFTLSLYPLVILIAIIVKRFGPNKILVPVVQIAVFLHPILWIKIMIELVSVLATGQFLYLALPLGAINFAFGGILLMLGNRALRMIEFPLVLLLELHANIYLILIALAIRLAILGYFLHSANRNSLGFYFELSLMAVITTTPLTNDQFLNTVGYLIVIIGFLTIGANETHRAFEKEKSILSFADLLEEEDEEEAVFEVYSRVEEHHVDCDLPDCLCHNFY
jgi:hypothetical protein